MNIRFARVVALVAAIAMLTLAACSTEDREGAAVGPSGAEQGATPAADTDVTMTIKDRSFREDQITVAPGTTVTWVNEDEQGHTITNGTDGTPADAPLFDEPLNAGQTVSYTFDTEGTYDVTCKVHPEMQMTVVVQAGS